MPAGRCSLHARAAPSRDSSTGGTQRARAELREQRERLRVVDVEMRARRRTAPRPASRCTAPMSLASTRKSPLSAIRRSVLRSDSDSISACVDSTTSLPAAASASAELEPVGEAQLVAARADDFAEVDDVDRRTPRPRRRTSSTALARPVVEQRARARASSVALISTAGDRRRACAGWPSETLRERVRPAPA